MASKIERLMALCDEATPANDGGVVPTEAWNRYCRETRPETLRAMLTLMQEMREAAELHNLIGNPSTYEACRNFDRWNEESEEVK